MRLIRRGQSSASSLSYRRRYGLFQDLIAKIVAKDEQEFSFNAYDHLEILSNSIGWKAEGAEQLKPRVVMPAIQHLLGTTGDLFKYWKNDGLSTVFIAGKPYSTHVKTAEQIATLGFKVIPLRGQTGLGFYPELSLTTAVDVCEATIKHLSDPKNLNQQRPLVFILDDGGVVIRSWETHAPKKFNGVEPIVIGAEQTNGGSNGASFEGVEFPTILISQAYVKKHFEIPYVADVIFDETLKVISEKGLVKYFKKIDQTDPDQAVGVVGYGPLGKALAKKFHEKGFRVIVHEHKEARRGKNNGITFIDSFDNFIDQVSLVISATGKDITHAEQNLKLLTESNKDMILISAGSGNKDYETFLRRFKSTRPKGESEKLNPLDNFIYTTKSGHKLTCVRGLFPANFIPGAKHSVPPDKIFSTRALIAGSLEQGLEMVLRGNLSPYPHMYCPWRQWQIVQHVNKILPDHPALAAFIKGGALIPAKEALELIISDSGLEDIEHDYKDLSQFDHLIKKEEAFQAKLKAIQASKQNNELVVLTDSETSNLTMKN